MDEEDAEIARLRKRLADSETRLCRWKLNLASGKVSQETGDKFVKRELAIAKETRRELEIRYRIKIAIMVVKESKQTEAAE